MRRFRDEHGAEWTAALWCGSYGEVLLIFSCSGCTEVFSAGLEAESLAAGETQLLGFDDDDLKGRLEHARRWDP